MARLVTTNHVWEVKNKYQGNHGIFSTYDEADKYIRSKLSTRYGSCWGWDAWKIKKVWIKDLQD